MILMTLLLSLNMTLPPLPDSAHAPALRAETQDRDRAVYNWKNRFEKTLERNRLVKPKKVMIGDSITHFWGGEPSDFPPRSNQTLKMAFPDTFTNMGCGYERTENVLWRIEHGLLDGIAPETVVLLIGTNNLVVNNASETVDGIDGCVRAIRSKLPKTRIVVLGILPRRVDKRAKGLSATPAEVNALLKKRLAGREKTVFKDVGKIFLSKKGELDESFFSDGLHPNSKGYQALAKAISSIAQ